MANREDTVATQEEPSDLSFETFGCELFWLQVVKKKPCRLLSAAMLQNTTFLTMPGVLQVSSQRHSRPGIGTAALSKCRQFLTFQKMVCLKNARIHVNGTGVSHGTHTRTHTQGDFGKHPDSIWPSLEIIHCDPADVAEWRIDPVCAVEVSWPLVPRYSIRLPQSLPQSIPSSLTWWQWLLLSLVGEGMRDGAYWLPLTSDSVGSSMNCFRLRLLPLTCRDDSEVSLFFFFINKILTYRFANLKSS